MRIKELLKNGLITDDHWLLKAKTKEEDVIILNGRVIWKNGTWEYGTWESGTWESGTWEYGVWKNGTWKYGVWESGVWKSGVWEYGTWEYGTWEYGIWKTGLWKNGVWEYGVWESGTWKDGVWKTGLWKSGTWESGFKSFGRCKWSCYYSKDKIKIGCETKSVKKWKKWLGSDKEFETKREDPSFKSIENTIRLGIAIVNTLKL